MHRLTALLASLILTGCATVPSPYVPVIDRPGPTYAADLSDCQALAHQRDPSVSPVVAGAAVGAALGSRSAMMLGAALSGGSVLTVASLQQRMVVVSCLAGRGHKVLL